MPERLSSLDGSFLRVETPNAHMHVAWSAVFRIPVGTRRPTLGALQRSIARRLPRTPRFRCRLAFPPAGLGEPYWVEAEDLDLTRHVVALAPLADELDDDRFASLRDLELSTPLDRAHPLWQIALAPRLTGGRCAMVAKIHHALVDGKSAVEVAQLLFDLEPEPGPDPEPDWHPPPPPGRGRLAIGALADNAGETLRAAGGVARMAGSPRAGGARLAGTLRRAALAVGEDFLRPAPSSHLNVPIGPARKLVSHRARMDDLKAIKASAGTSLNDVCLALVTGGLRELALARGRQPTRLKAMVPVSTRAEAEREELGNRISLVFVELPVHVRSPRERLRLVNEATSAFKRSGKSAGAETVLGALGTLPEALRGPAARIVGSARVYNLTVSNVPGPPFPLYMLGTELLEAYPVVPIAERHSLSVGMFSYRDWMHFGLYADPKALPEASDLAPALAASMLSLRRSVSGARRATRLRSADPTRRPSRRRAAT
jgi:WS/DGAT/MGAT family acyltransferase